MDAATRRRLWLGVRLAVAGSVLGFTLWRVPRAELVGALASLSPLHLLLATALISSTLLFGAARWRLALVAFGAETLPPYAQQVRLYFIGMFFNTYVPGGVGGDVLRAELSRRATGSVVAAWASVLTERVLGLSALLVWAGGMVWWTETPFGAPALYIAAGLAALVGSAVLPTALRWRGAEGIKNPHPAPLLGTFLLGLLGHITLALAGYAIVSSVSPGSPLTASLVVVPLAQVAVFFPGTVGGLGVREVAFVELFGRVGVEVVDATATAFGFLAVNLVVAAIGGVVHVLTRSPDTLEETEA